MRYYKQIDNDNNLLAIGTGYGGTEITETEYNSLLAEIREKDELVDKLYSGEITIEAVPVEWVEEIARRVNKRIEQEASVPESEKTYGVSEDVYNAIIDDYTLSLIEEGALQ